MRRSRRGPPPAAETRGPAGLRLLLSVWAERLKRRRALRRLLLTGAHLVADLGLAPEAARREAAKPFWRA